MRGWVRALGFGLAILLSAPNVPVAFATTFSCSDVHAIYATGANNTPGGGDFTQFTETDLHHRVLAPVTFSAYALGADAGYGGFRPPMGLMRPILSPTCRCCRARSCWTNRLLPEPRLW
jgi:hypothetical protein